MKNATHKYYQNKIEVVLQYIHNHLNENLSIDVLAEFAGISLFHFHRIFKGVMDEPIGSYIDRVRIGTAIKLIRYSEDSISSIATKIGYNDTSSFSKAFTKEFGVSPQEYRSNREIILNSNIDCHINNKGVLVNNIKPKVIFLPDKKVVYIRVTGEYGGKEVSLAWEKLADFIKQNRLLGWNPDFFLFITMILKL